MTQDRSAEITSFVQAIQFRTPTASDIAAMQAQFDSGATLADFQARLASDPYTTTNVDPVIRLYQAAFGRVPDQAGLSYWSERLADGSVTFADIAKTFAASAEFNQLHDGSSGAQPDQGFLAKLYELAYGRTPDAAGMTYWAQTGLTVDQVLVSFVASDEMQKVTTPPSQRGTRRSWTTK